MIILTITKSRINTTPTLSSCSVFCRWKRRLWPCIFRSNWWPIGRWEWIPCCPPGEAPRSCASARSPSRSRYKLPWAESPLHRVRGKVRGMNSLWYTVLNVTRKMWGILRLSDSVSWRLLKLLESRVGETRPDAWLNSHVLLGRSSNAQKSFKTHKISKKVKW